MAQIETWLNQDMMQAVKVRYLDGNLFSQDNAGNLIGVILTRDGEDYSGGGTVSANVIRSDGGTVAVTGALSGNVATVVLPQSAYAVPGVVSIVVKLTVNSEVTTIAAVVANIYQSSTETAIDPGTIIPSIQTLVNQIDTAVASIPADYSTLWTTLAPAFSTSTAYTAGQYVTYNGGLYRFTANHVAGAWSSSDVSAAVLGNELSDVKCALALEADRSMIDMSGFKPGDYAPYKTWDNAGLTHELYPGIFKINGTSTGGRLVSLLGNDSRYANATTCSANQLNQGPFSVTQGHQYKITLKRVAGSITDDTRLYLAVFDTDGSTILAQAYENEEIIFTANTATIGQLCYFTYKNHTWTSCEYVYTFEDVTEILLNDTYYVPAYYNTHLSTAISKINNDINAGKTVNYGTDIEAFVFLTDVHWANNKQHSPGLVRKILNDTPVKTVICGGDIIYSHNETKEGALEEIHGFTNAIVGCPCYDYYAVFGNHDDNSNGGGDLSILLTKDEQYNAIYAPFADKSNVHWIWQDFPEAYNETAMKNDYYFDHSRTRTRYICMDWNNPFNTVRITWLQSVLGKNDGYRVIIIYHGIYTKTVDGQGNITFNPEHIHFMSYLEPYKSKIVALITGHAHADGVVDYFGDGSIPVILTDCDTYKTGEGTVDEQCFDVMVVDYLNSKIKITRIGRGSDREVNISLA